MSNSYLRTSEAAIYGEAGLLRVERAAFDHIEMGAKIAIVGITPGSQQRSLANAARAKALFQGHSGKEADRLAKFAASFGGAMRNNLVRMLDYIGAARWIGLDSFRDAFDPTLTGRVHFTSVLRYPVFFNDRNYNGQPDMLRTPLLRKMIDTFLNEEVKSLPGAIWQPLGDKPLSALTHLVRIGVLQASQIAPPLPHPSGANAERIAFFLGNKDIANLSSKTKPERLNKLRHDLIAFYKTHSS